MRLERIKVEDAVDGLLEQQNMRPSTRTVCSDLSRPSFEIITRIANPASDISVATEAYD
jgi:hypothetical protein